MQEVLLDASFISFFLHEHCTYYTGSENKHIPNLGCYTKKFEERDLQDS